MLERSGLINREHMRTIIRVLLMAVAFLAATPQIAAAYIGPGAGLTAIGTVIAFIGAILLALVGFVWYPIKRLRSRNKKKENSDHSRIPS